MSAIGQLLSADHDSQLDSANTLLARLSEFFATREMTGKSLCIALSGGRDSVVLSHALSTLRDLKQLTCSLSVLHIHHGLSPNADSWADFCRAFCQQQKLPLRVIQITVPKNSGQGLEAAARAGRYREFSVCQSDWLALAHHQEDQAETLLLNLFRGTGAQGAAGMPSERRLDSGVKLIRPLLFVSRRSINAYAAQHQLRWIDDESNQNSHFRRNFLRNEIFPALETHFHGAQKNLASAAANFSESALLHEALAQIDSTASSDSDGAILLARFNELSAVRAKNLLRYRWRKAGFRAPAVQWMEEALRQLANTKTTSSTTCLRTSEGELYVCQGKIFFRAASCDSGKNETPSFSETVRWSGETHLGFEGGTVHFIAATGKGLSKELLESNDVYLTRRQGGETLRVDPKRPRRAVKKILQEARIPAWERKQLPFLWCGEQLVWVANVGQAHDFACQGEEAGLIPCWEPRANDQS